jgi:hypothetical protein
MAKSTRRDVLAHAFDAVEAGKDPLEDLAARQAEEAGGDLGGEALAGEHQDAGEQEPANGRSPDGKFVPKPAAAPVDDKYAEAPKSWKPEQREKFKGLPPEVRAYLHTREEEQVRGVEPIKAKAKNFDLIEQALSPIREDLQRVGVPPDRFLADVAVTVATLAKGTPEQKFQTWMQIAQSYGVPVQMIQQLQGQQRGAAPQMDQVTQRLLQQVNGLQQQVQGFYTAQEAAVLAEVNTELQRFGEDPANEHFEAVRETMGRLIQAGTASDLKDAYTKAIRLHDDLFESQQAAQRAAQEKAERERKAKAAQAARGNAFSPRSSTPTGTAGGPAPKGRREAIAAAFDQHVGGSGRV